MEIMTFESKQPWEIVPYTLDWTHIAAVAAGDYITSVAFAVYLSTDDPSSPTPITAMVYATAYSNTTTTCWVGSQADAEGTYILRTRAQYASGMRLEQEGIFVCKEI